MTTPLTPSNKTATNRALAIGALRNTPESKHNPYVYFAHGKGCTLGTIGIALTGRQLPATELKATLPTLLGESPEFIGHLEYRDLCLRATFTNQADFLAARWGLEV